ncbi:glycosyltransferase family 1 protein [Dethiosulfatarculus sandiegensis]|uniref:Glycosyl transferase family 1 domain-containing protein n=1 Tax=Dethiosulfatarculus sandiegensis TaxID=1429043 RepID=A0A0D2G9P0_9BACT|nr:glycosyltransferase family 1 protein [Dethiosulfatarculus sandiegensis]KIX11557.1 hypothetical protein X474_24315 [Dethiosulfatarculus sandiegensis]
MNQSSAKKQNYSSPRLKIWCLFVNKPYINPSLGDSIGEYRIIKMLSQFADVYYNGILVNKESAYLGTKDYEINIPKKGYDLYYVRANKEVFLKLPHPKIYMAYPYDEEVFSCADGLVVTTRFWKKALVDEKLRIDNKNLFGDMYPDDAIIPKNVVQFKQCCDDIVSFSSVSQRVVDIFKCQLTRHTTFGFYGRLSIDCLNMPELQALNKIKYSDPIEQPIVVFAGKIRKDLREAGGLPKQSLYIGNIEYNQMANLLAATDFIIGRKSKESHYLGANSVLDAINMNTPVITTRTDVRDEYLGENYLGSYDTEEELDILIKKLINDPSFLIVFKEQLQEIALKNSINNAANFTKKQVINFLQST